MINFTSPKGFNPDPLEKSYFTEENGFIILKAYLLPGIDWNEENRKQIECYIDLSYLLSSRARLLNLISAVKITDALTGSMNLHGFQETVGEILSMNEIQNYTVIMLNFKHFKYINKKYTPDNGDIILRKYSMMIRGFLETSGYIS